MASIGHEISYRSGQKNHWRRWVWNRITETLPKGIRPRDATVLYLPGEADLDWPEARRRGYQRENMIACERDPRVVRALRARGVTTISLSLALAMQAWPQGRPVHVVHADLCSGITSEASFGIPRRLLPKHAALVGRWPQRLLFRLCASKGRSRAGPRLSNIQ